MLGCNCRNAEDGDDPGVLGGPEVGGTGEQPPMPRRLVPANRARQRGADPRRPQTGTGNTSDGHPRRSAAGSGSFVEVHNRARLVSQRRVPVDEVRGTKWKDGGRRTGMSAILRQCTHIGHGYTGDWIDILSLSNTEPKVWENGCDRHTRESIYIPIHPYVSSNETFRYSFISLELSK